MKRLLNDFHSCSSATFIIYSRLSPTMSVALSYAMQSTMFIGMNYLQFLLVLINILENTHVEYLMPYSCWCCIKWQ